MADGLDRLFALCEFNRAEENLSKAVSSKYGEGFGSYDRDYKDDGSNYEEKYLRDKDKSIRDLASKMKVYRGELKKIEKK